MSQARGKQNPTSPQKGQESMGELPLRQNKTDTHTHTHSLSLSLSPDQHGCGINLPVLGDRRDQPQIYFKRSTIRVWEPVGSG